LKNDKKTKKIKKTVFFRPQQTIKHHFLIFLIFSTFLVQNQHIFGARPETDETVKNILKKIDHISSNKTEKTFF
jgi:Na+/H+ antiporter NhaB